MSSFILAVKTSQSQMYDPNGHRVPVTNLHIDDNYVLDVKSTEKDGYAAIKIGMKSKKMTPKSVAGVVKKSGVTEQIGRIKEFRIDQFITDTSLEEQDGKQSVTLQEKKYVIGDKINLADIFHEGDIIDVTSTSKGKGFQGVMKRHGFGGGPRTHGQSDRERATGSIGSGTTPGRVYKGKKLAGRMGGVQRTVKGLAVLRVEENQIIVKGLVPGHKEQVVSVKKSTRLH